MCLSSTQETAVIKIEHCSWKTGQYWTISKYKQEEILLFCVNCRPGNKANAMSYWASLNWMVIFIFWHMYSIQCSSLTFCASANLKLKISGWAKRCVTSAAKWLPKPRGVKFWCGEMGFWDPIKLTNNTKDCNVQHRKKHLSIVQSRRLLLLFMMVLCLHLWLSSTTRRLGDWKPGASSD